MDSINLDEILEFAKNIAKKAGEIIIQEREKNELVLAYKDQIELVTSADLKSDQLIRESIQTKYPSHTILSEESSPDFSSPEKLKNLLWVIDPIDGTINYASNHQQVGISIAFAINGVVQVAVVYSPFQEELFFAVKGKGAFLNQKQIQVNSNAVLKKSLIGTGFPYERDNIDILIRRVKTVLLNCQDIRRVGSAALDLCWVAMGRLNGYYETVKPWDLAAGCLIAKEAGAMVGHLQPIPEFFPEDLFSEELVVAAPAIYDDLYQLLANS
ncbi:MAG: myo-inositol-1(or 4)-monophosphatase [bacterium]|jgi:myo-inositol-1(or 4)-monophosphatase